jgi:hypothetical protein
MSKTLEAIISSPSLVREQWLSPELAVREVLAFERRFGSQHLMLACHAALPLILNPELLNLIHINFLEEEQIPWVAEVDFLLSPLCRPIDDGLYEVEPSIREVLLTELENQFCWERPFELAKFLQYYLEHKSGLKPRSEVTRTQRWLAQAYLAPDKVVEELTNLLETSLSEENYLLSLPGQIQVTNTLELLAEPLERSNRTIEYQYLLNNSRVLAQILYGDEQRLKEEFREEQSEGNLGEIEPVQLLHPILKQLGIPDKTLTPLTPQDYRIRQALLNTVKHHCVDVLEKSLYNQVLIELGLEERPGAVAHPWNMVLETEDESFKALPQGTKVIDLFDQIGAGRSLLILGGPGSGKTIALLELTRDLIVRAEQDINHLMPVVFNLSSWSVKRQAIADWVVEELKIRYGVPKQMGQRWVKEQQLLLLLDSLDEVQSQYQEKCIAALNAFHRNYGSELVVCSRIKHYEVLSKRLNFQSAIYLNPLTLEQVCRYLDSVGSNFIGLRALIERDVFLQDLASSPLMLSIMLLAYEGVAVEELPKTNTVEEQRKHLFDAYIERMFRGRRKASQRYQKAQAMRWLVWLARRMVQESRTIFVIEQIQPFRRLQEYRNGNIPWDYARFLDYATKLGFLEKVGNGYIFIHRLLLEHFAQMELD